MSVATRPPRSSTPPPLPSTHFNNFRPLRYQTKEELDRFFGTTSTQKREQRLRVRESDGQVYFDWIEKDEWQHLLATGSLTSPSSPAGERRRSSAMTLLTLNSPLCPASPRRASSIGVPAPVSPLTARFDRVAVVDERRGRKRSNSAVARTARDRVCSIGAAAEFDSHSPRSSVGEDAIRISRLPLSRRRLDPVTMDLAFGGARQRKPATLHIPTATANVEIEDELLSPCFSSAPASPMSLATFDSGSRRGTFGSLPYQQQQQQQQQRRAAQVSAISAIDKLKLRRLSDLGASSTPPSSAMEFLNTPTPDCSFGSQQREAVKVLRHAASFDLPPSARRDTFDAVEGGWSQRQRWHSAEGVGAQQVRAVRSVASLRETSLAEAPWAPASAVGVEERRRKISSSSDGSSAGETCYTPLAPRLGAKKFDKTRLQHLSSPSPAPPAASSSMAQIKDPIAIPSPPTVGQERGTGLRTGPEVYVGIDIPCASIHLHSDPEDNVEPALALSLSARELRRMKKKEGSGAGVGAGEGRVRRSFSISRGEAGPANGGAGKEYAKGSSRWWNHILHG